jgi:hypothetical protein
MKDTNKDISGILNIQLGSPFQDKTGSQKFKLSHTSEIEGIEFFSQFKTVTVNIDPLNKKVFQIYAYLSFPSLDVGESNRALKASFNNLKIYLTEIYGTELISINEDNKIIFSKNNNEISLTLENSNLLLQCIDQTLRHNCYALMVAY